MCGGQQEKEVGVGPVVLGEYLGDTLVGGAVEIRRS